MRIALVGFTVPGSGVDGIRGMDNYIYQLGSSYAGMGHDAMLFVRSGFRPAESWIKTIYAPSFSWMAYPFFLAPRLLRVRADVFHSDYITTGVSMLWARRRPAVVSIHDVIPFSCPDLSDSKRATLQSAWYFRCFSTVKSADALIVMSESSRKEALEHTDMDESKIRVVYNGVDHSRFFPMKTDRHENIRIGYLGGLDGRKNVKLLVDSFVELQKSHDNIELHIGGCGRSLQGFRDMNIPNARFYGFIPGDRANEFYNSLDIFVFPSLAEGFGNMAAEAMAAGVPTVVANRTSLPEVVGGAGIAAEPDVSSMAKAIERLMESERLRKTLSKRSLERSKLFTWRRCAEETLKVYESVMRR